MPQAAIAPIISGVAALGGGILSSRAANHATDAQTKATEEAIAYQRQQDADARAREDAYNAENTRQYQAYLKTYYPDYAANMSIGEGAGPAGAGLASAARGGPGPVQRAGGRGRTLAGLVSGGQGATPPAIAGPDVAAAGGPPKPITDLNWSDWKRYLGAGA